MRWKLWWFIVTISILMGFTIVSVYSLILMQPPSYKIYWVEKIHVIRIVEIILGVFGVFSILWWFDYLMRGEKHEKSDITA